MYKALVKMRNKKGFTLMELLIVVAIIAILAAIAIPTFSSSLQKAKDAADEANARSMYAAVAMSFMTDDTFNPPADADAALSMTYDGTTYTFNEVPDITYVEDASWTITTDAGDSWTLDLTTA
ncbi:MAG TPA: prepilin-type N-terminal cleavage/methylation domain-containing protein [Oscillospiraceae bacterium]|nr:prepilin-type N-terminal cleavage/methylation domain-containing protein [Oscillospiraceae bacterium]HXK78508.1 prepilin-type N-terminal cleavage/methylation domain-containing protein [Oscillospiraceae bacterium]